MDDPQTEGAPPPRSNSEAGDRAANQWQVLRHRHYRNILFTQFFSNVGTWTEMFAIQMFVATTTGRLDDQGILSVCQQAPIFALGIFGGLTADRVNRRTLLVVTQILAGLVAAAVAVVSMIKFQDPRSAVHWLFFLGGINGAVMAFNFPAWQVLTPRLVPRHQLTHAITLGGIQFNLARVLGPAVAGLVIARFGGTPLLWFNAFSFLAMAGMVMTTPDDPAPGHSGEPIWAQIREALSFLMRNRGPRAVLVAQVLLSAMAAPLVRLLSNFVIDVYNIKKDEAGAKGGLLLAVQGIGAVLGGIALRYVPSWYPKHHFIPMAVTGLALSICLFALATTLWAAYLAMAVCGWFWIWAFNQSWAMLQFLTPDHLRGRAMSIANVCFFGAAALGAYAAGSLGEWAKTSGVLDAQRATQASALVLSVPLLVAGLWMMTHRVPEVDGLPRSATASRTSRSFIHAITAAEHRPEIQTEPLESV